MSGDQGIRVRGGGSVCPYCKAQVPVDERAACAACLAVHHLGCWATHGSCSTCSHPSAMTQGGLDPAAQVPTAARPKPRPELPSEPQLERPTDRETGVDLLSPPVFFGVLLPLLIAGLIGLYLAFIEFG